MRPACLVACLALLVPAAQAQMYKCVDERGVTHYSDKPSPDCKGDPVDIQGSPPMSGALSPRQDDINKQNADFYRRQMERERAATQAQAALAARCTRLRQENARLSSATRIAKVSPTGERVYMEDADREARLAQLKEELRGCP